MGDGVDGLDTLQPDAGLFLVQLTTLEVGLAGSLLLIGGHGIPVLDVGLPALQQGMLRRDDHVGGAEQGIGTGGIDGDLVADVGLEGDLGSGGSSSRRWA